MSEIQVLDQGTIDKIAAGEVVERPSSIAKELVENALDAGATRVTVEIRDGGIRLLRVTDNGRGIPAEEVRLAFLRHATSKLRTVGDFGTLTTLGFRGEALSSIAAVSRVEMITKRADELTGTRYCIEGGRERLMEEVGAPEGTTIIVRDIFYNTPARAKFLKTAQTEAAHVGNFIEKLALAKPSVAFEFIANGDSKLLTTGNGKLKEVIYQIYGREAAAELLPVEVSEPGLSVGGVIAKPTVCRGTRNFEMYFVNGRYVKSRIVSAAIEEGYGTMLMKHMYPFTCLFLELKGTNVDVNVHPTKMEVRFSDEKGVYAAVKQAVESTLKGQEMIVRSALVRERTVPQKPARYGNPAPFETAAIRERETAFKAAAPYSAPFPQTNGQAAGSENPSAPDLQSTGQAADSKNNSASSLQNIGQAAGPENNTASYPQSDRQGIAPEKNTASYPQSDRQGIAPEKNSASSLQNIGRAAGSENAAIRENVGKIAPDPTQPANVSADEIVSKSAKDGNISLTGDKTAGEASNAAIVGTEGIIPTIPTGSKPDGFDRKTDDWAFSGRVGEDTVFEQQELIPGMLSPKAKSRRRILGCAFRTYWIIEYGSELFLIDQHAAHEKVLYERLTKMYRDSAVTRQMISPPLIFTATLEEKALLDEYLEAFAEIGFEIEPFGGREYKVSAVPYHLSMLGTRTLFTEMLDHLETSRDPKKLSIYILRIATEACKAAVKGGDQLSLPEAEALIDELFLCEDPYHCPHGRPTIISFTEKELEKRFKRIV